MAKPTHIDPGLSDALQAAGGQSALGRIVGVGQSTVAYWVHNSRPLPAEHVLAVEAATGVSRHRLRPDIYPLEDPALPCRPVAPGPVQGQCDPRPASQAAPSLASAPASAPVRQLADAA